MPKLPSPFAGRRFGLAEAGDLASALKVLADPARLLILRVLWERGSITINALVDALGMWAQPTVSHHVRLLAEAGFVRRKKRGVFVRLTLTPSGVIAVAVAINPEADR